MNSHNIELPSNKKFGLFFSLVFIVLSAYLFLYGPLFFAWLFLTLSILVAFLAIFKPKVLFAFNKMWMNLGILIGIIISPIVLGFIFFFIFTPVGLISRLFGRDELNLKKRTQNSNWQLREIDNELENNFRNQF